MYDVIRTIFFCHLKSTGPAPKKENVAWGSCLEPGQLKGKSGDEKPNH